MSFKPIIFILLVHCLPLVVYGLRCQCSTQDGAVTCYNGWCEVHNYGDKIAACAVVQHGPRQHYACVRVKRDSDDSCKVDKKNGESLVRCWCRSADYCNVDLADRVEDGDMQMQHGAVLTAEELPTSTMLTAVRGEMDDFQIEQNYDTDTSDALADWDSDELGDPLGPPPSIRTQDIQQKADSFVPRLPVSPHQRPNQRRENEQEERRAEEDRRRLHPLPATRNEPTLPPWRREFPIAGARNSAVTPPPQPDHFRRLPPPPFVRPAPPSAPRPTTTSTTTTSTTTTMSTTTTTPRTTTTTSPSTTTTTTEPTTTTRRWIAPVRTTPDPKVEAARRAAAAKSYREQKRKYRPFDLNERKSKEHPTTTEETKRAVQDDSDVPDELFLSFSEKKEDVSREEETTTVTPTTQEVTTTTKRSTTERTTTASPLTMKTTTEKFSVSTTTERALFGPIAGSGIVGGGHGPPPKMKGQQIPKSKQDFYQEIVRSSGTLNYLIGTMTVMYLTIILF